MLSRSINIAKRQLAIVIGDIAVLVLAPLFAINLYFIYNFGAKFTLLSLKISPLHFIPHVLIFLSIIYLFDLYNFQQNFKRKEAIFQIISSVVIGGILTSFAYFILGIPQQGRGIFLFFCIMIFLGLTLVRLCYSILGSVGMYDKNALIIGCGDSGKRILKAIRGNQLSGIKVIAFIDNDHAKQNETVNGVPVLWQEGSLKNLIRAYQPQLLIVAMRRDRFVALHDDLIWSAQNGMEIWDVPTAFERLLGKIPLQYVDETWLLFAAINWPKMHVYRLKRIQDIIMAGAGLLLAAPVFLLTALSIYLESGRPVFIVQPRIGKKGRTIPLLKFRSMYQSAPINNEKGTDSNDSRVTRVGRILRRVHVDELPQLLNVIKGDLSLVGPRAELIDFVHEYIGKSLDEAEWREPREDNPGENQLPDLADTSGRPANMKKIIPFIEQRFTIPQGITGWAQVMEPYVTSTYEDMVKKLEYDLYYIKNMSFFLDMIILLKTVRIVLLGRGK